MYILEHSMYILMFLENVFGKNDDNLLRKLDDNPNGCNN